MLKKSWGTTGLESSMPEMRALAEKKISALMALFPADCCHEMVEQALSEKCSEIPEEAIEDLKKFASSFASNKAGGSPQTTQEEENATYLKEKVRATAKHIVVAWLKVLYDARYESGDKPVRLDSSLSPPPELSKYEEFSWEEWLEGDVVLTAEQIRKLMKLYTAEMALIFDLILVDNPNGYNLMGDLIIHKDTDGFYLPPQKQD